MDSGQYRDNDGVKMALQRGQILGEIKIIKKSLFFNVQIAFGKLFSCLSQS